MSLPSQAPALADHQHPRAAPGSVESGALHSSAFGTSGQITAIDPDDPAVAGATGKIADAGHQHPAVTGTPAALTKTATSAESAGTGLARDTHVHATSALGWGIVARMTPLTTSTAAMAASTTTDMAIANVVVDSTRLYVPKIHTEWAVSAGMVWHLEFRVDGVVVDRMKLINTAGAIGDTADDQITWEPTSGTKSLDIRATLVSGAGNLTLVGGATNKRHFWVEDIGPR